jgi:hypothetical protein
LVEAIRALVPERADELADDRGRERVGCFAGHVVADDTGARDTLEVQVHEAT